MEPEVTSIDYLKRIHKLDNKICEVTKTRMDWDEVQKHLNHASSSTSSITKDEDGSAVTSKIKEAEEICKQKLSVLDDEISTLKKENILMRSLYHEEQVPEE